MEYQSLTDEELIPLIKAGDEDAEAVLYRRYKQVVRSKARTYFLAGADREDLIQEGMIGLYKAVYDFNPEKQPTFKAFAEMCIKRQIITAIKSATRKKHMPLNNSISLDRQVFDGESERTLIEMLQSARVSDPEEAFISREDYETIARNIEERLTPLEKSALSYYIKGFSYQHIAKELNRSVKCIDNAIQRVKKKLEDQL
ncbi:MAG: RNA polymerase sporulation sigma factor SigH [Clostridia bacterium]|nr:RNA polymerase sporulation sigma factor SigH [Clostridia bacterium]